MDFMLQQLISKVICDFFWKMKRVMFDIINVMLNE